MTSYFDSLTSEISDASAMHHDNEAAFLLVVGRVEERAERAARAIAQLDEFPVNLRDKIAHAIARSATARALDYRRSVRASMLVDDLHSIFHQVASAKIATPFGTLSDDPEGTLKRLAANGEDEFYDHVNACPDCNLATPETPRVLCTFGELLDRQWGRVLLLKTSTLLP